MQWAEGPNAGFCPAWVEPWLPIADDYQRLNVAFQREDLHTMLALTRALIEIRRTTPALRGDKYRSLENVPEDCFVYLRQSGHQRRVIVLNFSSREQTVKLVERGIGQIVISTYLDREEPIDLTALRLRSDEACIIAPAESMEEPVVVAPLILTLYNVMKRTRHEDLLR